MPAASVMEVATTSTGGIGDAPTVGVTAPATGANRTPARRSGRHREAMAHTHLKSILGGIDRRHPLPEQRPVAFTLPQDQVHPGMNHLVAERALGCFQRQLFQQRSRQHNLAATAVAHSRAEASNNYEPASDPESDGEYEHKQVVIRRKHLELKDSPLGSKETKEDLHPVKLLRKIMKKDAPGGCMLLDQLDDLANWANTPDLRGTFGPLETYLQYDFEAKVYFVLADCPNGALVVDKSRRS